MMQWDAFNNDGCERGRTKGGRGLNEACRAEGSAASSGAGSDGKREAEGNRERYTHKLANFQRERRGRGRKGGPGVGGRWETYTGRWT